MKSLHFLSYCLHSALWGNDAADGTLIGTYTVRYEDGTSVSVPIHNGVDVRDWLGWGGRAGLARGVPAWAGSNPPGRPDGNTIRLYVSAWDNPHPDKEVTAVAFLSTKTHCAPFCVAMTVEEPVAEPTKDRSRPAKSAQGGP